MTGKLPPVLVNGLPKAGTHLLHRVVGLFPGTRSSGVALMPAHFRAVFDPHVRNGVPIGVGRPIFVPAPRVAAAMARVKAGGLAMGHVPYSDSIVALLGAGGWRSLLILRDPRDVVVSAAQYALERDRPLFRHLSLGEAITRQIEGFVDLSAPEPRQILDIRSRFDRMAGWRSHGGTLTTTYEDLVGSRGAGSDVAQAKALGAIARHVGLPDDAATLLSVAEASYGSTPTFRHGTIGRWRSHFTASHRQQFAKVAGALLSELGYERDDRW